MTRNGHGLYTLPASHGGFSDLSVGVLANGFFPRWMQFLGHDISAYPKKRPRSPAELGTIPAGMVYTLPDLFASMPEIDDLYAEIVGGAPGWILVAFDQEANARRPRRHATERTVDSTYGLFSTGADRLACSGRLQTGVAAEGAPPDSAAARIGIGKLVLGAGHKLASDDLSGQRELDASARLVLP